MNYKTSVITEAKAQEILLSYLNRKRMLNKLTSHDIRIRSMKSQDAIIYILQSYRISQKFIDKFTAKLQPFENLNFDHEISTIDLSLKTSTYYDEKNIIIPETENIKLCHTCNGVKHLKCKKCSGTGSETCWRCSGLGLQCYHCNYRGMLSCSAEKCLGGKLNCFTCEGYGSVKWYKEIEIKKDMIYDDFVKSPVCSIPDRELKKCHGEIIVEEKRKKVLPINHFPDVDVNVKSKELIQKHQMIKKFDSDAEIIGQFHQLSVIPITTCTATYKNKPVTFYIIGKNNYLYISKDHSTCSIV